MCERCAGTLYIETDHYGTHESCFQCGRGRVISVVLVPSLWAKAGAAERPGGLVLSRPYGRVLPR